MNKINYHDPVLLQSSVAALITDPNGIYVDVTFGGGGHSSEILKHLDKGGRLFAFDQDEDALQNTIEDDRFKLIAANFKDMKRFLKLYGVAKIHGVLGDFGVSSHQFDAEKRGFSIRFDGPLDMRMNQNAGESAQQLIATYSLDDLTSIFKKYGEIKGAYRVAEAIVAARSEKEITTTFELIEVVKPLIPERYLNKTLAQLFQAIRIEVNQELEVIQSFLAQAADVLQEKGRLVCISYHSLEDRLVKRFIRDGVFEGKAEEDFFGNRALPLKKVGQLVVPTEEEIARNNRARSAKMRIAEKR